MESPQLNVEATTLRSKLRRAVARRTKDLSQAYSRIGMTKAAGGYGELATFIDATALGWMADQGVPVETNWRQAKFDHSRTSEPLDSESTPAVKIVDTISTRRGKTQKFKMLWVIEGQVDLVVHGQGFEVFCEGNKLFDAIFEANVPTSTMLLAESVDPESSNFGISDKGHAAQRSAVLIQFEGSSVELTTTFRSETFNYLDRGLLSSPEPWSRFVSSVALNYLLRPAKSAAGSKILVVAFSAVSILGDFNFNYRASLEPTDANALYILDDFGNQGSYYLMDHGDDAIFASVQLLISKIAAELQVPRERIVMIGSSKGGAAAILHGVTAGVGHVYVGAPQTKIGTFVSSPHPNILKFMTGAIDEKAIGMLDDYLYELVENTDTLPKISIVVGDADHHYKGHVVPFADHMASHNKAIALEVLPGIPHSEIGAEYKKRLVRYVENVIGSI